MTGDIHDPRPKGADDALQAGAHLRLVGPEEAAARMAEVAAAAGPVPAQRPPVPIAESLPGWPYSPAILAPAGYEYRPDGIGQYQHPAVIDAATGAPARAKGAIVRDSSRPAVWTVTRRQPIAIVERRRDLHTGMETHVLAWHRDGRWHDRPIPREVLRDSRRIVKPLAALGIDVTSDDASGLVAWLAACEAANLTHLPPVLVSSAMGWQDDRLNTFLWGREALGAEPIRYQGSDTGGESLATAYQARGTLEGWQAAVSPCQAHPHVLTAVYVALSAPLLALLDAPSYVLDVSAPTSEGKTSTLQAAASVWGQPNPAREPTTVRSWDTTLIGAERTCASLGSLPMLFDDTSRAKAGDVPTMIYLVVQGQGRTRGTPDGTARTTGWLLPMISTGEAPLRSYGTAGGRTARTLTLWGPPWVGRDAGPTVRAVVAGCRENYGHAGPALVRYLLAHRDTWPGLREQYRRTRQHYVEQATGPTGERLAEYVATLDVALTVADLAQVVPWARPDGLLPGLWPRLAAEVEDAHGAEDALRAVYSVALAQRDNYWSEVRAARADGSPAADWQPTGGWQGRWDRGPGWAHLCIQPQVVRELLERLGYAADATLRAWADRGWLERDAAHLTRQVKWAGDKSRLVCIRAAAISEVMGDGEVLL